MVVLPLGALSYLVLWFQVLDAHDYYLINLLFVLAFVWSVFFHVIRDTRLWRHPIFNVILVLLVLYSTYHCNHQLKDRYVGWKNEWFKKNLEALTEIEPIFQKVGLMESDKVISIPDPTVCGTLYLMNRNGYNDFASDFSKMETFEKRISQGANYLVVNDSTILGRNELQPYIKTKLAEYKNITIYDLRNLPRNTN
jgi:hypothetical protein